MFGMIQFGGGGGDGHCGDKDAGCGHQVLLNDVLLYVNCQQDYE